jgi:threonine aldolase
MNFISDNAYGAAPEMVAAIQAANDGAAMPYGDDAVTARLQARFSELFAREVWLYPVLSGTAANALALAQLTPPYGAILCHCESHIAVDECAAPEFFSGGAKLVTLAGKSAKLTPAAIEAALLRLRAPPHSPKPTTISITQATEAGTVYSAAEISAIGAIARREGLKLHMDGARFAAALAHLGAAPADLTWRVGVDALSFGATKNGAFCAEAVIFFDKDDAKDFEFRRKKSGHLVSKMRFISAQLDAAIEDGRWLAWAGRANALAATLAEGLAQLPGAELAHPAQINAIFVRLPDVTIARLRQAGAKFYDWGTAADGRITVRLVVSCMTPQDDVARFLEIARDGAPATSGPRG